MNNYNLENVESQQKFSIAYCVFYAIKTNVRGDFLFFSL